MKRLFCLVICIMLLTASIGAYALEKEDGVLYSAKKHDLQGVVFWTSEWVVYEEDGGDHFFLNSIDLKTGKTQSWEEDGYLVLGDADSYGVLLAYEDDNTIELYS